MNFRDNIEVTFIPGDILSAQMLEETYRYPREFLHLLHEGHSDGIISGLDFVSDNNGVCLTAGIVKHRSKYYILPSYVNLDEWLKRYEPPLQESVEYFLELVSEEVSEPSDLYPSIKSAKRLILKAEREKNADSIILGKYKIRSDKGICLPTLQSDTKKPFDEFTRPGLFQILYCEYAHSSGETTYHPLVFRAIKQYLEKKSALSPYEFTLLSEIQNHGIIAISTLRSYVSINKKVPLSELKTLTREKLFQEVVECVQKPYIPMVYVEGQTIAAQQDENKRARHSKLI